MLLTTMLLWQPITQVSAILRRCADSVVGPRAVASNAKTRLSVAQATDTVPRSDRATPFTDPAAFVVVPSSRPLPLPSCPYPLLHIARRSLIALTGADRGVAARVG